MGRGVAARTVGLAICLAVLAAVLGMAPLAAPRVARAAEYAMTTEARYRVDPDAGEVAVTLDVSFENTTPDPPGQFSAFEVIDLALQPGATEVAAQDVDGALAVSVGERDTFVAVAVRAREAIRYGEVATFTLAYTLHDGAGDTIRIRPSVVLFPAWSFGTSATVKVTLPESLDVRVDGGPMTATHDAGSVILESGAIESPASWLARITGTAPSSYVTTSRAVALAGGTVELQVRSWSDDTAWGERVADLLADGLPRLEDTIGIAYPRVGPLVVVETTPDPTTAIGEPRSGAAEIDIAFNEPDFTVLHQAAHVWLRPELIADGWIREGFASWAAAQVAQAADVSLPYDPADRAEALADASFPLVSWGAGDASVDQDAWAYAASWDVADRLARSVGAEPLRAAFGRAAAGVSAYDPPDTVPTPGAGAAAPLDSRRLLDQLEAASDADVDDLFVREVFDADLRAAMSDRATARTAFTALVGAAAGWGAPEPVRADMAAWRFEAATGAIDEAQAWLADRDALYDMLDRLELTAPTRLMDRYRTAGGGTDARTELDAERAVAVAYGKARDEASAAPGLLERIGVLGGPGPSAELDRAASLFGQGDLRGAADTIDGVRVALDQARLNGVVRLGAAAAVVTALVVTLLLVARRRRSAGYTAAP